MKRKYELEDYIGKRFGELTVTGVVLIPYKNTHRRRFLCKCTCGKEDYSVEPSDLINGRRKTCGHYHHNLGNTDINNVWRAMKRRCYNKNVADFSRYGGRGISVCEEWKNDFLTFYRWAMENGYKKGLQIDRINSDGNYEPSNCRWISPKENSNNRKSNHLLTLNGKTQNLKKWSEELGIPYATIKTRLKHRLPVEKVLNPIRKKGEKL